VPAEYREDIEGLELVMGQVHEGPAATVVGGETGEATDRSGPEAPVELEPAFQGEAPPDARHTGGSPQDREDQGPAQRHAGEDVEDERRSAGQEQRPDKGGTGAERTRIPSFVSHVAL
jgi:hypothetical protein